jgi:uncharacterized protein
VPDAEVDHVEVTELHEGTFLAAVSVHGPRGKAMIHSRPSDSIAQALPVDAPMFAGESAHSMAPRWLLSPPPT